MAESKRPPKARIVSFCISLYDLLTAGHVDQATVSAQLKNSGMFLYTGEVDKIAEKEIAANPEFNGTGFAQMLYDAGILVEGSAPVFGGSGARINSKERAVEVANDSNNADLIVELITEAIAIKTKVNELISDHATFSYALKNKKSKDDAEVPVSTEETVSPEDMQ